MYNVSLNEVIKSYNKVKLLAHKYFGLKDIDQVIELIDISAIIASNFNWIYTDQEIENLLKKIAEKYIINDKVEIKTQPNNIVFYDQIGSTECLGLQYLRGLLAAKFEILYIFESSNRKCSPNLINELNNYSNAKILIVDSGKIGKIDMIVDLYKTIQSFKPSKTILHSPAEGAFGIILWNSLPQIKRYRIVPGDHHFYLGTSCSDYFFEFRSYGYTVSIEKRNIQKEKILMQPYYPIVENCSFSEFPIETKDKVIILSSGALYKTYGEDNQFFDIMKHLLTNYPQVIILFAGEGFNIPFKNFIKKNNFENRLILLGYRTDYNMCVANADIYLATFPFTGGLTSQIAAYYSKPILSYTTENLSVNYLDDFIGGQNIEKTAITFTNLEELYLYADKLILNSKFRLNQGTKINELLTTKKRFEEILLLNLNLNKCNLTIKKINIDYDKFVSSYINIENKYIPRIRSFLINKFRCKFIYLFPLLFFHSIFSKLLFKKFINDLKNS